ncbi:MAG TPA: inositol monophosphatase [Halothiobacillaceae bacterium]|nr:inositol monophosphatase [Halothiobacillaceae bacterium]
MHPMLNIAVRAARSAGDIIDRNRHRITDLTIESKQRNDYVSDVDRQAEASIINTLTRAYPDHAILAEESGDQGQGESDYRWIIDPLDGTTNFLHGIPHFAVSIALEHQGKLLLGLVYNPVTEELFVAERGNGAFLNNRRIRVTKRRGLEGALLATGIPFNQDRNFKRFIDTTSAFYGPISGVRRFGSAALDLAYVACGRFDGYWEYGLKPWDVAAGALLVREAGGVVIDTDGSDSYLKTGNVIAANPKLTHQMLQTIKQATD